jgi:hypothetical protein
MKPCDHKANAASTGSYMAHCGKCGKLFDLRGPRSRYERIASTDPYDDPLDPCTTPSHSFSLHITNGASSNPTVIITSTGTTAPWLFNSDD